MGDDEMRTSQSAVVGEGVAQRWADTMGVYSPGEYRRTTTKRSLFPHQRNVIEYAGSVLENWQSTSELLRRGLLAFHNVGAGKTIEMLGIMLMAGIYKPDAIVVFMGTKNQIENLFMNGDLMNDYNSMAIPDSLKLRAGCPVRMEPSDSRMTDRIPLPRYEAKKYPKARYQRAKKCGVLDPERFGYVETAEGKFPRVIGITIQELAVHVIRRCRIDRWQWSPCHSLPPIFNNQQCEFKGKAPPNLQKSSAWLPIDLTAVDTVILFDEAHNLQKPPVSRVKTCNPDFNYTLQYFYAQQFLLNHEIAYRSYLVLMTSTPANSVEDFLSFSKLLVFPDRYPRLDGLIHQTRKANGVLLQEVLNEWSFLVEGTIDAFNALNNFCIYPRIVFKNTGQPTSPFDTVEGVQDLVKYNPRFTRVDVLKQLLDPARMEQLKPEERKVRRLYFGAFNPDFDPKLDKRKDGTLSKKGLKSAFRSQAVWFSRLLTRDFVASGLQLFSPKLYELLQTVTATRAPEARGKQLIACNKSGKYNPAYAIEAGLRSGGAGDVIEQLDVVTICRKAGIRAKTATARSVRDALVTHIKSQPPRRRFFSLNFTKTDVPDEDLRSLYWAAIRSNDKVHPGVFNLPENANGELLEILVLNDPPDFEGTSLMRLRYIHVFDVFPMDTFGQIIGRGQRPFAYQEAAENNSGECGAFSPGTIEIAVYVNQWPEVEQQALFASFARKVSTTVLDGSKPWVKKLKRRLATLASHPKADVAADARDALQHLRALLTSGTRDKQLRTAYGSAGEAPTLARFLAQIPPDSDITKLQAQQFFNDQQGGDGEELGGAIPVDAADLLMSFRKNLDIMKMYVQAMKIASNCYRMEAVHRTYGGLPAGAGIAPPGQQFTCAVAGRRKPVRPTTEAVTLDIQPVIRRNGFLGPTMALVANRLYGMLGWTTPENLFDKQTVMRQMKNEYGDQAPAAYETFVGIVSDLLERT